MRRLVYVSGSPGAGKTSLAAPLAAELGYALLTKDLIKETLHDALGAPEPGLAARRRWSRKLGGPPRWQAPVATTIPRRRPSPREWERPAGPPAPPWNAVAR